MVDWHVKYNYCSGANAPGQKPIRPSITFGRSTDDANNEANFNTKHTFTLP